MHLSQVMANSQQIAQAKEEYEGLDDALHTNMSKDFIH